MCEKQTQSCGSSRIKRGFYAPPQHLGTRARAFAKRRGSIASDFAVRSTSRTLLNGTSCFAHRAWEDVTDDYANALSGGLAHGVVRTGRCRLPEHRRTIAFAACRNPRCAGRDRMEEISAQDA